MENKEEAAAEPTEIITTAQDFWADILRFGDRLTQTWALYQLVIISVTIIFCVLLARALYPKCEKWFENKTGIIGRISHVFVDVHRRLALLIYVPIGYSIVTLMQIYTWPSRSFFVDLSVKLAFAWLIISVVSSFIKNKALRSFIMWLGWIIVTLQMTGFLESTKAVLDSAALEIGDTRISLLMIMIAIFSLAALFILASLISKAGAKRIDTIEDMSPSIKVLLGKTLQIALYTTAFLMGLKAVGFDLGSLAVLSGAIGLGIGFGLQKIVSNLISGIIILLDKSIKPGDVISLDGTFGWITQLGARYASVTTRDGREHLIPNEDFITNQVINWSHSSDFVRLDIFFGVDYDSNPHEVKKVASQAPLTVERVVNNPAPVCHVVNFGDSSIDFILRFWIRDPNKGLTNIRGNVYLALWDTLQENNINIPFPRREITMLNPPQDDEVKTTKK
ncbi:mechanosensitive ion channel [Amylibacter sp. SFDW26]|uniref:mechanosensitive ion channel family protein n=1 Tax=Amylibacter sp. SFDW26 TaxID=2652722 RepID=UPI001261CD55|nr:mechanosensitive ion channel domain-containing protein [Amylibacter sp. SFDW26]KAB7614520.1 mechanosensitive ion channel [Amylibacter sp. SFDW26]